MDNFSPGFILENHLYMKKYNPKEIVKRVVTIIVLLILYSICNQKNPQNFSNTSLFVLTYYSESL